MTGKTGKSEEFDRRERWKPAPRPEWVSRINAEGEIFDKRSIVPLDENSLLASARENTGLSDFGEDGWIEHFRVLVRAIEDEARLNLMGRILTRIDFVSYLETRLRIQDAYRRHPEIEDEVIHEPVMILGHGRTGTTILHEVLSTDPRFRIVKRWEAMFPCPPPEAKTYRSDPRIALADARIKVFDRVTPEWTAMHAFGGELPVECAEYLYASFLSNVFVFSFQIPSYAEYLAKQDVGQTIRWHQRFLKLLQWKYKEDRWLLKNPIWIDYIPRVLEFYPDAKIVLTHRDPITVGDSFVNVMGTIFWWRTDDPWGGGMLDDLVMADGRAATHQNLMRWMEDGTLRPGQVANVQYADFMHDPAAAVHGANLEEMQSPILQHDIGRSFGYERCPRRPVETPREQERRNGRRVIGAGESVGDIRVVLRAAIPRAGDDEGFGRRRRRWRRRFDHFDAEVA